MLRKTVGTACLADFFFTSADTCGISGAFLNDTVFPADHNYQDPTVPFFINGKNDPTSQRFHVSTLYQRQI